MKFEPGDAFLLIGEDGSPEPPGHPFIVLWNDGKNVTVSNLTDIQNESDIPVIHYPKDSPDVIRIPSILRYRSIKAWPLATFHAALKNGKIRSGGRLTDATFAKMLAGAALMRELSPFIKTQFATILRDVSSARAVPAGIPSPSAAILPSPAT